MTPRRGILFTMDALLASLLLLAALVIVLQYFRAPDALDQTSYYAQDTINALNTLTVGELTHPDIAQLISDGADPDKTILEQLGTYWAAGDPHRAENLSAAALDELLPDHYGLRISFANDELYTRGDPLARTGTSVGRRMITGIAQGAALAGATSAAYLSHIQGRELFTYVYFGGFVGQGNLTVALRLPADVNNSDITSLDLEADIEDDFEIFLNGHQCLGLFTPSKPENYTPEHWNLSACTSDLHAGGNHVEIRFPNDVNNAYIGGGYLRAGYRSSAFQETTDYGRFQQYLPGIDGIVNLYDSFTVPGKLDGLTIKLHYFANHSNTTNLTFYMTVGNTTILADDNSTSEQWVTFTNSTLAALLNYSTLSYTTVPIRLGFQNLSFSSSLFGNADVLLVTDVSGSMAWRFDNNNHGTARNCDDPNLDDPSTSRISVAKCLDKSFAESITNITGNAIGLVSYEASTVTADNVAPTTNRTVINNTVGTAVPMTGYTAGGATCICCGINSARDLLTSGLSRTTLVARDASWRYNDTVLDSTPAPDAAGRNWTNPDYDDSHWPAGNAILGATNGQTYTPAVTTELHSSLAGTSLYPNLWEHEGDTPGPPNDFSSGQLNSTGNSFGISGADDGWDWQSGTYDYPGAVTFRGAQYQLLNFFTNDNNQPVSGAYGILINITRAMADAARSPNGRATLSFTYRWDETGWFERYEDEVWVKGRWTSPTSGTHWLGSDLDNATSDPDPTPEIAVEDDPDADITDGVFSQDITDWIEGEGMYYLDLGGKLLRDSWNEEGYFSFDNIQIEISNTTDHYYYRTDFTVADLASVRRGVLNVLSDDVARVYLNGRLIDDDPLPHTATYWNRHGHYVPQDAFRLGNNVLAVEVQNTAGAAKFALELLGINDSRTKAMMVMTDGQANYECAEQGTTGDLDGDGLSDTASDDAVQAACDAREGWGIAVYSVGFSDGADEPTLEHIAACGDGIYQKSNNVSALKEFYTDVAFSIIEASVQSQTVVVTGAYEASTLYNDSHINVSFTPTTDENLSGLELVFQTPPFGSCTPDITIPQGLTIIDAAVTSYSGEHWSSYVGVNGHEAFNLSRFNPVYQTLGDPFSIAIPAAYLIPGAHNHLELRTGDSEENTTGCSANNTLIYRGLINATTPRSAVVERREGCVWTIAFEDGTTLTTPIPADYSGPKNCSYNASTYPGVYDEDDAYDRSVAQLLNDLDFDDDGEVLVNLASEDLQIVINVLEGVPYLWGPTIARVEVET